MPFVHERRRIRDNGRDFLVQPRLVAAAEDEFGNKIRRAAGRLSQGHAEPEKIFGVHCRFNFQLMVCLCEHLRSLK